MEQTGKRIGQLGIVRGGKRGGRIEKCAQLPVGRVGAVGDGEPDVVKPQVAVCVDGVDSGARVEHQVAAADGVRLVAAGERGCAADDAAQLVDALDVRGAGVARGGQIAELHHAVRAQRQRRVEVNVVEMKANGFGHRQLLSIDPSELIVAHGGAFVFTQFNGFG